MLFRFEKFEKCIGDHQIYRNYIAKMKKFCDMVLDENKIKRLVYTLLEILRQDDTISDILYGVGGMGKSTLLMNQIHNERACAYFRVRRTFRAVRFNDENSPNFELPIDYRKYLRRSETPEI